MPPQRKAFCNAECRANWHNRRKARGAELYDFAMAWRFDRETPDMLAQLGRLLSAYHTADQHHREGRRSWNVEEAQMRLPLAVSNINGDGR